MTRFSRLRRSAALLLLTAGFGGFSAGTAWSCIGAQESHAHYNVASTSKAAAIDAYISGFRAMATTAEVQEEFSLPTLQGGTIAQAILTQQAKTGQNSLGWKLYSKQSFAEHVCTVLSSSFYDSAKTADLELLSLKFRAMEQIETAALAHCREIAVNAHLLGSIVSEQREVSESIRGGNAKSSRPNSIAVPSFSFDTVTTTVTVPDGGTILISGKKFELRPTDSSDAAEAAGMESSRQLLQRTSPTPLVLHHVGADGLERIGIDFEVTPQIIISEEEELLGVATNDAPPAPRTLPAALMANAAKKANRFHCVQISPADYIEVTAYSAVMSSYEALLEMPFSMDKLLTLQVEITPLLEEGTSGVTGCFGPEKHDTPVLRMSSLTQERMLRHFAKPAAEDDDCPGFKCADANALANAEYQFPNVNEWKQLSSNCKFGPALAETPILRMPSRIPERLLRLLTTKSEQKSRQLDLAQAELEDCPGFICSDLLADRVNTEHHLPEVTSWKQLQAKRTDAAPAENPEETGIEPSVEEFVQQLPPNSDAPLANPPEVAATPRVVSPTMSPLEYAETFLTMDERNNLPSGTELLLSDHNALTGRIMGFGNLGNDEDTLIRIIKRSENSLSEQQHDDQVKLTAHDEPAKAYDNPMLRALGGPISVTPCESETCKGFTIQFAPCEKQAAAEAQAFDGPAQVLLQDGPGKFDNGFALQVQPVNEESLDELAQRLEREFLRRAVNGQIQIPETCQSNGAPVCVTPFSKSDCTTAVCPPGPYAERGTPGFAIAVPECSPKFPSPSDPPVACQPGTCCVPNCPGCPAGSPCGVGNDLRQAALPGQLPAAWFSSNPGVCGNIGLDPMCQPIMPAPPSCGITATVPCLGVAPCCNSICQCQAAAAGCQCAECPKGCGGECCCAKKDRVAVPAVTWNPYATEPATVPTCTVPAPQMAMVPHTMPGAYAPFARAPLMVPPAAPVVMPTRPAASPELMEFHREVSRTLDQLAERCESQGLFENADELRDLAREYRMSARVVHKHLNAMSFPAGPLPAAHPVAWYPAPPMMPYPMPAPATYAPEPMPTFGTPASPVAPATHPQPLPIAQPMMVPRY